VEVAASLSQGHTAAAQCGLFTHKSVPVIFEPLCILKGRRYSLFGVHTTHHSELHCYYLRRDRFTPGTLIINDLQISFTSQI